MGKKSASGKQNKVERAVAASSTPSSPSSSKLALHEQDGSVTLSDAETAPSATSRDRAPKVNNASLADLKNTCDDAVKEFFAKPNAFTRSHVHEDVRLALGWTSVVVAAATGYYGYVTPFNDSKYWVTVGVVVYMALSTLLTIYVLYFERNTIFEGKRRTFASRISTERLSISSLASSSPGVTNQTPTFPLSLVYRGPPPPTTPASLQYPAYHLWLEYSHLANNGKALIHQSSINMSRSFGDFFDTEGVFARPVFEAELQKLSEQITGGKD